MDEIQTDRSFQGEHGPSRAAGVISQVDTTQAWGQLSLWSQDRGSDLTRIPLPQGSHDLPLAVIISDRMGSSVSDNLTLRTYRELLKQYSASHLTCFSCRSLKLRIYFPAFVKLFSRHPKWKCRMLLENPLTVAS